MNQMIYIQHESDELIKMYKCQVYGSLHGRIMKGKILVCMLFLGQESWSMSSVKLRFCHHVWCSDRCTNIFSLFAARFWCTRRWAGPLKIEADI